MDWIPVNQKLPENMQIVIATLKNEAVLELTFIGNKFKRIGSWGADEVPECNPVVAWQPMPDPFKIYSDIIPSEVDNQKAKSKDIQVLMYKIHDILVQLKGIEPNDKEILEIIQEIPKSILAIGIAWGYSDTVFGDELYVWIRDNKL